MKNIDIHSEQEKEYIRNKSKNQNGYGYNPISQMKEINV